MNILKTKNLFVEIKNNNFLIAVGEYDEVLNFKITDKEIFSSDGYKNGKINDLESCVSNLKKIINKLENRSNFFFSDVNVIINQSDFDCVNINGYKKLNGNQILSEDISFILNDIKSKLIETEKYKTVIHLFNTKYLLDNKIIKNLPIGLYGNFYSHQLTFFMINNNEIKNIKKLFNKSNLSPNKIILKSFTEGIKIVNKYKKDNFLKINIKKNESQLIFFDNSAFAYFQKFNFGSDIILKDISKVCSLEIENVRDIILMSNLETSDKNIYVDKNFFDKKNFRKISLKHIVEISSARIEEIANIVFNHNKNLLDIKNEEIDLYLDFEDKNIEKKFKKFFQTYFKKCSLKFYNSTEDDTFMSIEIFGDLLSKGWTKEAIPVVNKKSSLISRIFSGFFE